ncbi:hypothetical protein J2790_000105 [Paenarthrobacter nicotinovorans]|uniref:hypothetical protein n=1 Tax=Micrococcaceae TaxID=1268 RepID=UPI0008771022|nr:MULTISPECIES: hypothetical protein [Micrococcaceae]MDR6434984.1 hypothetical protein [Paenarthrobacter nicotinovorans]SCZ59174.1 hypothetical protein SAMN02799638_02667 [Arthrobacter sp. UNCCL28]
MNIAAAATAEINAERHITMEESQASFPRGYITFAKKILKDGKRNEDGTLKPDGTIVSDEQVISVLNMLIELDIDATEKVGPGIAHWVIYSNRDQKRNSVGYRIMRVDGTGPIKFGYSDVLKPPKPRTYVQRALTDEVAGLMVEFRKAQFNDGPVYCAVTGVRIEDFLYSKAVHREPSRSELHEAFLLEEGLTFETVDLRRRTAPHSGFLLADRTLAARWIEYQRARLDGMQLVHMDRFDR